MKNIVSKLVPLVSKLKGKKKIVVILSVVAIAAYVFAVQKGYIAEDAVKLDVVIDYISNVFTDSTVVPVDSIISPVDTLAIEVVDSITAQ
jgi:hypothetical protein